MWGMWGNIKGGEEAGYASLFVGTVGAGSTYPPSHNALLDMIVREPNGGDEGISPHLNARTATHMPTS